ncbi:hypothetical protein KSC_073830 [Ktedonobacter sp. SOSP1-52]|nr:hypothetical protein KSC_073830 [Ktedonobacter sp. SOSP1-52]
MHGDVAAIGRDLSIHMAIDNKVTAKGHHITPYKALNDDFSAKRGYIAANHLPTIHDHDRAKERFMIGSGT